VVLGGLQRWWLQPIVSALGAARALLHGPLAHGSHGQRRADLPRIADRRHVGRRQVHARRRRRRRRRIDGHRQRAEPAGLALLKRGFADESVGAGGLFLGALAPTVVAAAAFLFL
jgi:hypothetical protein